MTRFGRRIRTRPPADADVPALVGLMRERLAEFNAGPPHIDDSLSYYWNQPGMDRARHHLVVTLGRRIVGTALAWPDPGEARMTMLGYVTARARGRGIGSELVAWFDALARSEGAHTAAIDVPAGDTAAIHLVERAGYDRIRTFRKLEHHALATVAEPPPPDGVTYSSGADAGDMAEALTAAYTATFLDHFDFRPDSYRRFIVPWIERPVFDPELVTFAREASGALAGYVMVVLSEQDGERIGDVDELGVVPSWRRRGLGSALLARGIRQATDAGAARVEIGVDIENPNDAGGMYERAGFRPVSEGHVYRKALRPEVDAAGLADERRS